MNTNTSKKLSNYNKTILSVVIISAVTGGLVLLENYRKEQAVTKFTKELSHYEVPVKSYSEAVEQKVYLTNSEDTHFLNNDAEQLAKIADHKLFVDSSSVAATQTKTSVVNQPAQKQSEAIEATVTPASVDVLFALSSASISPEYKLALANMAKQIKAQGLDKTWQLIGHTDKSGHVLYNLQLAKKRAQNVANFLIEKGVNEKQLKLVTLGEYEATQLTHSTYNKGLRKVQVVEYKPEVDVLAVKLQKRFEKLEQLRIDKEELARTKKIKVETSIDESNTQITLDNETNKNEKTSVVLESSKGANVLQQKAINDVVELGNEPLVNNTIEVNEVSEVLSNFNL